MMFLLLLVAIFFTNIQSAQITATARDFTFFFLGKASLKDDSSEVAGIVTVSVETSDEHIKLGYFYDGPDQWDKVYKKDQSCDYLLKVHYANISGSATTSVTIKQQARPRFWFFAAYYCPPTNESMTYPKSAKYAKFDITLKGVDGAIVNYHERKLSVVYTVFLVFALVLLLAFFVMKISHFMSRHFVEKIFGLNLLFEALYYGMEMINFYQADKTGILPLKTSPSILRAISSFLVTVIYLLISDGYMISKTEYPNKEWAVQIAFINLCGFFVFIYGTLLDIDIGLNYSYYNSYGGLFLVATYIFITYVYLRLCIKLINQHIKNQSYAIFFTITGAAYFLVYPLTVILCYVIDPWERFRVTTIVYNLIVIFCNAIILVLMFPCYNGKLFKFDS